MSYSYIFWNARGIGTSSRRLKKLVLKFQPKVVVMVDQSKILLWKGKLKFNECCSNVSEGGKLWIFWNHETELIVDGMGDQYISVMVKEKFKRGFSYICLCKMLLPGEEAIMD